ncbi:MAG: HEAT repeat domain-containing protein, partial [bacterium]
MSKKILRITIIVSLLVTIFFSLSWSAAYIEKQDEDDKAYKQAYNYILDENWNDAIKSFDNFIKKFSKSRWVDDAEYWQCYAREQKGESLEKVFDCYQNFIREHSRSKWVDDAKSNLIRIGYKLVRSGKNEYKAIVESMRKSEDEEISLAALYALQQIGDERALKTTIDMYDRTENESIRGKIVYALANYDSPEVISKLVEISQKDPSPKIRKNAVYALGNKGGKEGAEALKKILRSEVDSKVRASAIYALGNTNIEDMIPFIRDLAVNDKDESVAKAATYSIGNMSGKEATEALKIILKKAAVSEARSAALY